MMIDGMGILWVKMEFLGLFPSQQPLYHYRILLVKLIIISSVAISTPSKNVK